VLTPDQLRRIFAGVEFEPLAPFAAPEPSVGAAIRLDNGAVAALAYGKGSQLLRVDLPANDSVAAFLKEVALPPRAITWRRTEGAGRKDTGESGTAAHLTVGTSDHNMVVGGQANVAHGRDLHVSYREKRTRSAQSASGTAPVGKKATAAKRGRKKPAVKKPR